MSAYGRRLPLVDCKILLRECPDHPGWFKNVEPHWVQAGDVVPGTEYVVISVQDCGLRGRFIVLGLSYEREQWSEVISRYVQAPEWPQKARLQQRHEARRVLGLEA